MKKANATEYQIMSLNKNHLKEILPAEIVQKVTRLEMQHIANELGNAIENSINIESHLRHILKYRGLLAE